MSKDNILHELIDVISGRQAHLSAARAEQMHDEITPGYNDLPVTEEQAAAARAVLAQQAREQAAAAAAVPVDAAPAEVAAEPGV